MERARKAATGRLLSVSVEQVCNWGYPRLAVTSRSGRNFAGQGYGSTRVLRCEMRRKSLDVIV